MSKTAVPIHLLSRGYQEPHGDTQNHGICPPLFKLWHRRAWARLHPEDGCNGGHHLPSLRGFGADHRPHSGLGGASQDMAQNDLRLMEAAVAEAEELNFSRASQQLRISQPVLTKRIADLEGRFTLTLFERDSQAVALTEAGRAFCRTCSIGNPA